MAITLDPPDVATPTPSPPRSPKMDARATRIGWVQWLVAALLVGAGAVHLALAPSHFGESTVEGVGFLVAAWLQIALAVAVLLRPTRVVIFTVIAVMPSTRRSASTRDTSRRISIEPWCSTTSAARATREVSLSRAAELGATDESGYPAVVANTLANAHFSLGRAYREAGALERAIEQYRLALELRPRFNDIRLELSKALIDQGRPGESAIVLDDVLNDRPSWLAAMLLRGLASLSFRAISMRRERFGMMPPGGTRRSRGWKPIEACSRVVGKSSAVHERNPRPSSG